MPGGLIDWLPAAPDDRWDEAAQFKGRGVAVTTSQEGGNRIWIEAGAAGMEKKKQVWRGAPFTGIQDQGLVWVTRERFPRYGRLDHNLCFENSNLLQSS